LRKKEKYHNESRKVSPELHIGDHLHAVLLLELKVVDTPTNKVHGNKATEAAEGLVSERKIKHDEDDRATRKATRGGRSACSRGSGSESIKWVNLYDALSNE
jgi:hypothetical protein